MAQIDSTEFRRYWSVAKTANRRAVKHGTPGRLHREDIRKIFQTFTSCLKCGTTSNLTIDHITPLSLGGTNDLANLQVLCFHCNNVKRLKVIDYRP